MKPNYVRYLANKVLSFAAFVSFNSIILNWHKQIEATMPYNIWEMTSIGIIINIIYGVIIGWFLSDNISLKINKKLDVITIIILVFVSIYQLLYFIPITGNSLSPIFLQVTKYFQWALGVYIFLILKDLCKMKIGSNTVVFRAD